MDVPGIKHNNRSIKERFHIRHYQLPWKKITKIMIQYQVMNCASQFDLFSAKNDISSHYSPHMIMTDCNFDYVKYCVYKFCVYVQGSMLTMNMNISQTVEAIYLRPKNSL